MEKLDDIETADAERDRSYFEPKVSEPVEDRFRFLHERINKLELRVMELEK